MIIRLVINHVGLCSSLLSSLTHSSCVRSFTCDTPSVSEEQESEGKNTSSRCIVKSCSQWWQTATQTHNLLAVA